MKRLALNMVFGSLVIGIFLIGFSGTAVASDVCGRGISEPPFLAYGVNSNLLMLLDNSGSMLDMGYIDSTTQCFDESFVSYDPTDTIPSIYAGNFSAVDESNNQAWYKWVQGIAEPWGNRHYNAGDIVYANGAFYKALTSGDSNGENFYDDENVKWENVLRPSWKGGETYHEHTFVFDNDRAIVYYTRTGGAPPAIPPTTPDLDSRFNGSYTTPLTSNGYKLRRWASSTQFYAGEYIISADMNLYLTKSGGLSSATATKVTNDRDIEWEEADFHGWRAGIHYRSGNLATADGMIFLRKTDAVSAGVTIYDDDDDFTNNWTRMDEGYFEKVADATAAQKFCDDAVAPAYLDPADNQSFSNSDICVKINNPGVATSAQQLLAFAATGNFLNWAMSSKFDIQKSILTGGKYNSDTERVVGESRGCAGNRFIKQVAIQETSPVSQPMYITMTVRKSSQDDRVDSTDDTTRFEIYAITQNGMDFDACQRAVEGFTNPGGLGPAEADVAACVGVENYIPGQMDEHTMYHKSMQACWTVAKCMDKPTHPTAEECWKGGQDYKLIPNGCQDYYWPDFPTDPPVLPVNFPANISLDDPYRVCYGIFDAGVPHTQREGYVGRCWEPGPYVPAGTDDCRLVACGYGDWDGNAATPSCTNKNGSGLPCYFTTATGDTYRCTSSSDMTLDRCTSGWASGAQKCNGTWVDVWRDNFGSYSGNSCTPVTIQSIGFWEADENEDLDMPNNSLEEAAYETCVIAGLKAYCQGLSMPEVIDPSDQASSTDEAWNLPGVLVDSGIAGQLGAAPLLATKGYILPDTDPDTGSLIKPTGILQDKAKELRIGAMAFNANGAGTECDPTVDPLAPLDPVDRFCPKGNLDGAQIITPIRHGSLVTNDMGTADQADDIRHVDNMVAAINKVRATAWTPLAEAMYNAIGYYTQNGDVRLDPKDLDFQTDAEMDVWTLNRKYGKGFYVFDTAKTKVYQTVDGGTAILDPSLPVPATPDIGDDTGIKWIETGTYKDGWTNATSYVAKDIVLAPDGKLYITYTGGTSKLKGGASAVGKSGPLYDEGVFWEPLLDPVARWCQDNNILVITEGASTADISPYVSTFLQGNALTSGQPILDGSDTLADPATPLQGLCTNGLQGSTYFDDLTFFAHDPDDKYDLYPTSNKFLPEGDYPFDGVEKKNITTHIVVAGTLRDIDVGTDPEECNPWKIMWNGAMYGGTAKPVESNNPAQLKENLENIFNSFRQRASAGSAASVISSARGGEGAIYQAIFWPELARISGSDEYAVAWAGDVHGLFLDNRGFMYEDTNHDRKLTVYEDIDGDCSACPSATPIDPGPLTCEMDVAEARGEDIDGDGNYDCVNEDLDHDGHLDNIPEVDADSDGNPDVDIDGDGHLDAVNEDLDGDGYLDTGEDTNHNGNLDPGENIDGDDDVLDLSEDLDGEGCVSGIAVWGPDGEPGTSDDIFDPFVDVDGDGFRDIDEDVNGNGKIDCAPDGDRRVLIYFDNNTRRSMACYDTSVLSLGTCATPVELANVNYIWSAADWLGGISVANRDGTTPVININDTNLQENRASYTTLSNQRYIFTWNDLDNDGIVDDSDGVPGPGGLTDEIIKFESSVNWAALPVAGRTGTVANDFDLSNDIQVDNLIKWLRGQDWPYDEDPDNDGIVDAGEHGDIDPLDGPYPRKPLRSRLLPDGADFLTWRLGDIIHSTPMTVAAPAEGYHLIYNDFSFAQFLQKYKERRHVVYFGANDGMLHAVNAGFYNENERKFCLTPDKNGSGNCTDTDSDAANGSQTPFAVGTELWAYVPYNLVPHLKCLADSGYNHKYFLDQRPRIFDVQIFEEESACRIGTDPNFSAAGCVHPNGWGTILVGGMRFGGAPIGADQLAGHVAGDDPRLFTSSWFIMDITDPERAPNLLGELTFRNDDTTIDLGYTTGMPTMVIMKGNTETRWYLVFGSGPFDGDIDDGDAANATIDPLKGVSDVNAKLAILPLDRLVTRPALTNASGDQIMQASTKAPVRIPANPADPNLKHLDSDGAGTIPLSTPGGGFVSDMITVDFDINPSYEEYKADIVYFGTVEGSFDTLLDGRSFWDGSGKLYRLVTKDATYPIGPASLGLTGSPYGRGTTESITAPADWTIKPLIDLTGGSLKQPITAAPSVGTDGNNFWVYFGTGRFFDVDDKTDESQQSYYGIREPALIGQNLSGQTTRFFTWDQVERTWTNGDLPGNKGLWDVTDVLVGQSPRISTAPLTCEGGGTGCLPTAVQASPYLSTLDKFIGGSSMDIYNSAGTKTAPAPAALPCYSNGCADGWVRDFYPGGNRERNVGQATLLGGLVTYTTYQPFNDACQAEGNAYLYAEYYRTGTAWHKNIFGLPEGMNGTDVSDKLNLGRGLATTPNLHVGAGDGIGDDKGPKAFVQTSTGEILEIEQENLPITNYRTGRSKWKEYVK